MSVRLPIISAKGASCHFSYSVPDCPLTREERSDIARGAQLFGGRSFYCNHCRYLGIIEENTVKCRYNDIKAREGKSYANAYCY